MMQQFHFPNNNNNSDSMPYSTLHHKIERNSVSVVRQKVAQLKAYGNVHARVVVFSQKLQFAVWQYVTRVGEN